MAKWIQQADKEMDEKGSRGSFGKATRSKIAKGKAAGGLQKKKAVFAQNMKKISKGRKRKRSHGKKMAK